MSLSASEILAPKHFVQQCTVNKIIVNVITNADDNDHVHDHNDEYLSQMVMVTTMAIFVFTKFSASFLSSVTATIHPSPPQSNHHHHCSYSGKLNMVAAESYIESYKSSREKLRLYKLSLKRPKRAFVLFLQPGIV